MTRLKLKNGYIVTAKGTLKKDAVLDGDSIDFKNTKAKCEKTLDLKGKYILPGFVDIHFHGFNLFDFTMGKFIKETNDFDGSQATYENGFSMLRKTLPQFGVTGFYAASLAGPLEKLKKCYKHLANNLDKYQKSDGARVFGGFLEGCFINPQMSGALNTKLLPEFSSKAFESIGGGDSIKLVNVVPDYGTDSIKLIKYLSDKGIVVGAGHTNATCEQFCDAVKAGLKYCIHFPNGPIGASFKPFNGGGALEAVLKCDEIYAELITDGYHISPIYVRDIIKRKGFDKIIGITDCMFAAGSPLKQININGIIGNLSKDNEYIELSGKKNALYGSSLTMNKGFENVLNWLTSNMGGVWYENHKALGLEEALAVLSKIYSTNPCKLTGLAKKGFGEIKNGSKADLCVVSISGSAGKYKVGIESTIIGGNIVYSKNERAGK